MDDCFDSGIIGIARLGSCTWRGSSATVKTLQAECLTLNRDCGLRQVLSSSKGIIPFVQGELGL